MHKREKSMQEPGSPMRSETFRFHSHAKERFIRQLTDTWYIKISKSGNKVNREYFLGLI